MLPLSLTPKAVHKAARGHLSTAPGCSCSEVQSWPGPEEGTKAQLIRVLGLPLVIPAQHIEKQ